MPSIQPPCLLGFILLLLCQLACPSRADPLLFRTLAKGAFSGIQDFKQEVIKDKATWEQLWAAHLGHARGATNLPLVDFSKEMVVAVTMGQQHTAGYAIEISRIEPAGTNLAISVTRSLPAPGSMALQVLTAPFHFAAVARTGLKPEFLIYTAFGPSGR
jgi:hypothetical protein